MKIYFSASIAGGRKYLPVYKEIVARLKRDGHQVLTEHIVLDDIFHHEGKIEAKDVFERDVRFLDECDVMIAEVSNPSLGVGYEICYALQRGVDVLCVFQEGLFISKMITGNTAKNLTLAEYTDLEKLFSDIDRFLNRPCRN